MLRTFVYVTVIAFITGISALIYGLIVYNADNLQYFYIPNVVENKVKFAIVGNMHNFSYTGGIFGMIAGMIYLMIKSIKIRKITRAHAKSVSRPENKS
jgi:hypothetical protein